VEYVNWLCGWVIPAERDKTAIDLEDD